MSKLLDAAKNLAKKFRDRIFGGPDIRGNTTSKDPISASRYLWVSKPIDAGLHAFAKIFGNTKVVTAHLRNTKGESYVVGSNKMKRSADSYGFNNKQRRRLRSVMRRRRDELVAQAA